MFKNKNLTWNVSLKFQRNKINITLLWHCKGAFSIIALTLINLLHFVHDFIIATTGIAIDYPYLGRQIIKIKNKMIEIREFFEFTK